MESQLLTIRQAAERLHVSYNTIRNAITSGRLRAFRFGERGGTYRIDPMALESYKGECATWAKAPRIDSTSAAIDTAASGKKFECLDADRLVTAWRKQGVCSVGILDGPQTPAEHVG